MASPESIARRRLAAVQAITSYLVAQAKAAKIQLEPPPSEKLQHDLDYRHLMLLEWIAGSVATFGALTPDTAASNAVALLHRIAAEHGIKGDEVAVLQDLVAAKKSLGTTVLNLRFELVRTKTALERLQAATLGAPTPDTPQSPPIDLAKLAKLNKSELIDAARKLGCVVPEEATKAEILKLIEEKTAAPTPAD